MFSKTQLCTDQEKAQRYFLHVYNRVISRTRLLDLAALASVQDS